MILTRLISTYTTFKKEFLEHVSHKHSQYSFHGIWAPLVTFHIRFFFVPICKHRFIYEFYLKRLFKPSSILSTCFSLFFLYIFVIKKVGRNFKWASTHIIHKVKNNPRKISQIKWSLSENYYFMQILSLSLSLCLSDDRWRYNERLFCLPVVVLCINNYHYFYYIISTKHFCYMYVVDRVSHWVFKIYANNKENGEPIRVRWYRTMFCVCLCKHMWSCLNDHRRKLMQCSSSNFMFQMRQRFNDICSS